MLLLQRNQIPGPMSPRFSGLQHQQHPNLSQLIRPGPSTPNSQMSPHFNQQPQNQWNMRQQQQQPQQQSMQSPITSNVPKVGQCATNQQQVQQYKVKPNHHNSTFRITKPVHISDQTSQYWISEPVNIK